MVYVCMYVCTCMLILGRGKKKNRDEGVYVCM